MERFVVGSVSISDMGIGEFDSASIGFCELQKYFIRGHRNGSWRRLRSEEKALFRVSMWFTRVRSDIVSSRVVGMLRAIFQKLSGFRARVVSAGLERARMLRAVYWERVASWAPSVMTWLDEPGFIIYLGIMKLGEGSYFS